MSQVGRLHSKGLSTDDGNEVIFGAVRQDDLPRKKWETVVVR